MVRTLVPEVLQIGLARVCSVVDCCRGARLLDLPTKPAHVHGHMTASTRFDLLRPASPVSYLPPGRTPDDWGPNTKDHRRRSKVPNIDLGNQVSKAQVSAS